MSKNRAASIRARLKNRSDAAKQDFNLTLTHYGLERLLYRLSVSSHAPNFLLKGALLFKLWYDLPQRPTRDADLLGIGPDDIDSVAAVFHDVCVIEVDDGIAFEAGSVRTAEIRKEAGYGGVRVELRATLDGAQFSLQVDVGFGEELTAVLADLPRVAVPARGVAVVAHGPADVREAVFDHPRSFRRSFRVTRRGLGVTATPSLWWSLYCPCRDRSGP